MSEARNYIVTFCCPACRGSMQQDWDHLAEPLQCPKCQRWWMTSYGFIDADQALDPHVTGPCQPAQIDRPSA
jgi:Zn-finger nucleic acid-binding protein